MSGGAEGKDQLAARRSREDLGWLASSGVLPRKRKEISGIDASSTLALQAHVYEVAERTKAYGEGGEGVERGARRSALPSELLLGPANTGVRERDKQDKLHIKSVADRASECQAALERKAALYEKLARGEGDDEGEQYEVDFLRKAWMEGGAQAQARGRSASPGHGADAQPVDTMHLATASTGGLQSDDMRRERDRREWEVNERRRAAQEDEEEERRKRMRQEVLALGEATREERERAEAVKRQQASAAKSKQDKLKAAFLKKLMAGPKP